MAEFPGVRRTYLRERALPGRGDLALWQTVPPIVERLTLPARLRIALWTGRLLERDIDRKTTAEQVLAWVEAEEALLSAKTGFRKDRVGYVKVRASQTLLIVGGKVVDPYRRVVAAFEASTRLDDWRSANRGSLPPVAADDETAPPAFFFLSCEVVVVATRAPDASRGGVASNKAEAILVRPREVDPHRADRDRESGGGTLEAFEAFLWNRQDKTGSEDKMRPIRSAQFKKTFPTIPKSHKWHAEPMFFETKVAVVESKLKGAFDDKISAALLGLASSTDQETIGPETHDDDDDDDKDDGDTNTDDDGTLSATTMSRPSTSATSAMNLLSRPQSAAVAEDEAPRGHLDVDHLLLPETAAAPASAIFLFDS